LKTHEIMLSLIKSYLLEEKFDEKTKSEIKESDKEMLLELSKKHYVLPVVSESLYNNGIIEKNEESEFQKSLFSALKQYQLQSRDVFVISAVFEKAKIPHIFLKGIRSRVFWKDAYLRLASDIDVLVQKDDIKRASEALIMSGFSMHEKTEKDISFFSKSGTFIELHFSVAESGISDSANEILDSVWDWAKPENDSFTYILSEEMFYFHHIAHMAKHFEEGGCGIRPFIDLCILNKNVSYNGTEKKELLKKGGLSKFEECAKELVCCWFGDMEKTPFLKTIESYILLGGAFGTMENTVKLQKQKKGGERYILEKIFLPYDVIKYQYPVLQKAKYLTPLFEVVRWFKLIFFGGMGRSLKEFQHNASVNEKSVNSAEEMLTRLGLK